MTRIVEDCRTHSAEAKTSRISRWISRNVTLRGAIPGRSDPDPSDLGWRPWPPLRHPAVQPPDSCRNQCHGRGPCTGGRIPDTASGDDGRRSNDRTRSRFCLVASPTPSGSQQSGNRLTNSGVCLIFPMVLSWIAQQFMPRDGDPPFANFPMLRPAGRLSVARLRMAHDLDTIS